jgi:REP element-mobilizing transposase RayT
MVGHRRSIRHPHHNYAESGAYFITIVTHNRSAKFGRISNGQMQCNDVGEMISVQWKQLPERFERIQLDDFIVMPNHLHGILLIGMVQVHEEWLQQDGKNPTLGRVIGAFKSLTTRAYMDKVDESCWERFDRKLWQRNFHDRVIRNEQEFDRIKEYIQTNPSRWDKDWENVERTEIDEFDKWLQEL